jgi:iron-sulfur cluster assembly accessory protein
LRLRSNHHGYNAIVHLTPGSPNCPRGSPPVHFTAAAVAKLQQILEDRGVSTALRLGVVGGGCSGFKYSMQVENTLGPMDKVFVIDGLKIIVDATSLMCLRGAQIDYIDTLEGSGFTFANPNVTSICRCGSSFRA